MADVESNILEHEAEFKAFVDGFNLTMPGKDASLGKDMAVVVAEGIIERTVVNQQDATGGPIKANEPKYAARKLRKHGVGKVAVLTGQTLSLESVKGDVQVMADEIVMSYGTGDPPTKFATTVTIPDDPPTDQQKAEWLTEQGRPFYELDDTIAEATYDVAREALEDYLGQF